MADKLLSIVSILYKYEKILSNHTRGILIGISGRNPWSIKSEKIKILKIRNSQKPIMVLAACNDMEQFFSVVYLFTSLSSKGKDFITHLFYTYNIGLA